MLSQLLGEVMVRVTETIWLRGYDNGGYGDGRGYSDGLLNALNSNAMFVVKWLRMRFWLSVHANGLRPTLH